MGKTTTAVNLAASLAAAGQTILLIDLDPQGNASINLGLDRLARPGIYDVFSGQHTVEATVRQTKIPQLSAVTACPDLAGAEIELVQAEKREFRLREALQSLRAGSHYRIIVIDCPPSLGLLTLNGLVAADAVLVPLQCEYFALEGVSQVMRTIKLVQRELNPRLRLHGIVLTMFDKRNNLSELVAADARGFFGDSVYDTAIPRNVRISEAPSHGVPVTIYEPRSAGAQAYFQLAAELLCREDARKAIQL